MKEQAKRIKEKNDTHQRMGLLRNSHEYLLLSANYQIHLPLRDFRAKSG